MIRYDATRAAFYREKLIERVQTDTRDCYQCGNCSAGCPAAFTFDYTPNQLMRMLQVGSVDKVLDSTAIQLCVQCLTCTARCPRNIDIAGIIEDLKTVAVGQERRRPRVRKDVQPGLHGGRGPLRAASGTLLHGHVLPGHQEAQDGHGRRGPHGAHGEQGQDAVHPAQGQGRGRGASHLQEDHGEGAGPRESRRRGSCREGAIGRRGGRHDSGLLSRLLSPALIGGVRPGYPQDARSPGGRVRGGAGLDLLRLDPCSHDGPPAGPVAGRAQSAPGGGGRRRASGSMPLLLSAGEERGDRDPQERRLPGRGQRDARQALHRPRDGLRAA